MKAYLYPIFEISGLVCFLSLTILLLDLAIIVGKILFRFPDVWQTTAICCKNHMFGYGGCHNPIDMIASKFT
jgi:hypothetical protein